MQDIEEIKIVQRAYGYYIEHAQGEEIIDLFADGPGVYADFGNGRYLGKEGVKRYFSRPGEEIRVPGADFLHEVMMLTPVITVNPNGITAKGRRNGFGTMAFPTGKSVTQMVFDCLYENDYVKEGGVWKIQVMRLIGKYHCYPKDWVVPQERSVSPSKDTGVLPGDPQPDEVVTPPPGFKREYPTEYILPCHFNHPVTGKPTSERARNIAVYGKEIEEVYKNI